MNINLNLKKEVAFSYVQKGKFHTSALLQMKSLRSTIRELDWKIYELRSEKDGLIRSMPHSPETIDVCTRLAKKEERLFLIKKLVVDTEGRSNLETDCALVIDSKLDSLYIQYLSSGLSPEDKNEWMSYSNIYTSITGGFQWSSTWADTGNGWEIVDTVRCLYTPRRFLASTSNNGGPSTSNNGGPSTSLSRTSLEYKDDYTVDFNKGIYMNKHMHMDDPGFYLDWLESLQSGGIFFIVIGTIYLSLYFLYILYIHKKIK